MTNTQVAIVDIYYMYVYITAEMRGINVFVDIGFIKRINLRNASVATLLQYITS